MPRTAATSVDNNFSRGLITEATAMTFPENAVTESVNTVYDEQGGAYARSAIDTEVNSAPVTVASPVGKVSEFRWTSVGNNGTITFIVQQNGYEIRFFKLMAGAAISAGVEPTVINLLTYKTEGSTTLNVLDNLCNYADSSGYLIIVHPFCSPLSVDYDHTLKTFTVEEVVVETRDFEILDETGEISERPIGPVSASKMYDLWNAGWYNREGPWSYEPRDSIVRNVQPLSTWLIDYPSFVDLSKQRYPSRADVWWTYKNANEILDFNLYQSFDVGNTPAPRGHYIYNAFDIDRVAKTGIDDVPSTNSGQARPSLVESYAGRFFYSGVSSSEYSNKIYFSQIIESQSQFGKCYQINDPTSENLFDLLDSDGGVITIPKADRIISMRTVGKALLVIANNGVWSISGTDSSFFRATDYSVSFVSPLGGVADQSVVTTDNGLVWLDTAGVHVASLNQTGLDFQVANVSKETIQTFYDQIPTDNISFAKVAYNARTKLVYWMYSSSTSGNPQEYDSILVLNLVSNAFYPLSLPSSSAAPKVTGILSFKNFGGKTTEDLGVIDSLSNEVLNAALDNIIVTEETQLSSLESFHFVTKLVDGTFTFSLEDADSRYDWENEGLTDQLVTCTFTTGHRVRGELLRNFNANVVTVIMEAIDDSSLFVQGVWNYGEREGNQQQAYRYPVGKSHSIRRLKMRGKGKTLQLKFTSDGAKPWRLVGWTSFETGATQP